jgi:hypothetical protein
MGSVQHVFYHVVIKVRQLFYDQPPDWRQPSLKLESALATALDAAVTGVADGRPEAQRPGTDDKQ